MHYSGLTDNVLFYLKHGQQSNTCLLSVWKSQVVPFVYEANIN